MTTDGQKPLRVGQVLDGLLEEVAPDADADEYETYEVRTAEAPVDARATPLSMLPATLWERMMAAVDVKFDGDSDGDVRGKG